MLPGYRIQEMRQAYGPPEVQLEAVNVTSSGGLAHIYFADRDRRIEYRELTSSFPNLANATLRPGKDCARDGAKRRSRRLLEIRVCAG